MSISYTDFFAHSFFINLDRRQDRLSTVIDQFSKVGIAPTRLPAVDGQALDWELISRFYNPTEQYAKSSVKSFRGAFGACMSHASAISAAELRLYPHVVVFEDDVVFGPDFVSVVTTALSNLPDDWDWLYLGGRHILRPVPFKEHLMRGRKVSSFCAYAVNRRFFSTYIKIIESNTNTVPIDTLMASTHKDMAVTYVVDPFQVIVTKDYSDIAIRVNDPRGLHHDSWLRELK